MNRKCPAESKLKNYCYYLFILIRTVGVPLKIQLSINQKQNQSLLGDLLRNFSDFWRLVLKIVELNKLIAKFICMHEQRAVSHDRVENATN